MLYSSKADITVLLKTASTKYSLLGEGGREEGKEFLQGKLFLLTFSILVDVATGNSSV